VSKSSITTGQDAFLDIVANLVGILIILIVIVGAHAGAAARSALTVDNDLESNIHSAVLQAQRQELELRELEIDNEQLERLIDQEKAYARQLTEVRHQRMVELETVRQLVEKQTNDLDRESKDALLAKATQRELQHQLADAKATLTALESARVSNDPVTKTETIDHYPNPIARTVFTQEIHFRLLSGRLVWVPLDELVDEMKQHWRLIAENKSFQKTKQTIGPVGNFRLQYDLDSHGKGATRRVQFRKFDLIPVDQNAGEPVEQALKSDQSQWSTRLRMYSPEKTTVSVWVYPDSYQEHTEIKKWLHSHGYQMASWPMEHGRLISGSPDGFKTSAQ
jgi:hypothetical protein